MKVQPPQTHSHREKFDNNGKDDTYENKMSYKFVLYDHLNLNESI